MKKLKKLLALSLCGLMAFSLVGCGDGGTTGGGSDGTKTVINIQGYEAGVNLDWLRALCKEYEAVLGDESFEAGKSGVEFKIEPVTSTDTTAMGNSTIHMYVTHGGAGGYSGYSLAMDGLTVNIDDVVTEDIDDRYYNMPDGTLREYAEGEEKDGVMDTSIRDKVNKDYFNQSLCSREASSVGTGYYQCYAMPSYGIKTGLSYDAWNFRNYGLYIVDTEWAIQQINDGAKIASKIELYEGKSTKSKASFGARYFIKGGDGLKIDKDIKLSCGNDGVYGTYDDGLPTSMEEFFILCSRMKSKGMAPLTSYGSSHPKRREMITNLWASLGGYDAWQSHYTYETNGALVEVFDSWSTENAFKGISYVKKANTKMVPITKATGYLANDAVARYYAIAFTQIAYEEGWYSLVSSDKNKNHLQTEEAFVLNGMNVGGENELAGMLIEGDYWYNESKKNGAMKLFRQAASLGKDGLTEPDILWMSLPTVLTGSVTGVGTASDTAYTTNDKGVITGITLNNRTTDLPIEGVYADGTKSGYNELVQTNGAGAPIVINARYQNNAKIMEICKGLMQYIHTDKALSFYTGNQGVYRAAMDYKVEDGDIANLSKFQKSSLDMQALCQRVTAPVTYKTYNGKILEHLKSNEHLTKYEDCANNDTYNCRKLFEDGRETAQTQDWAGLAAGTIK